MSDEKKEPDIEALAMYPTEELWLAIKERHSCAMLILESDNYPSNGQSSTRVFWKGTQCALLGMPLLAQMRLDEYFQEEEEDITGGS